MLHQGASLCVQPQLSSGSSLQSLSQAEQAIQTLPAGTVGHKLSFPFWAPDRNIRGTRILLQQNWFHKCPWEDVDKLGLAVGTFWWGQMWVVPLGMLSDALLDALFGNVVGANVGLSVTFFFSVYLE